MRNPLTPIGDRVFVHRSPIEHQKLNISFYLCIRLFLIFVCPNSVCLHLIMLKTEYSNCTMIGMVVGLVFIKPIICKVRKNFNFEYCS